MAAEYSANMAQEVAAGGSVVFTESPVPCNRGLVYHRDESGLFRLASPSSMGCVFARRCCCQGMPTSNYEVAFHANIAVPATGDAGAVSLAIAIDGEIDPSSTMTFTPAAVSEFGNVGADVIVSVPAICRCASVSVRNVSAQAVEVRNANIVFAFAGIRQGG